jgi:hypothetical protein
MSVLSFNFLFVASAVMIATFSNAKLLSSEVSFTQIPDIQLSGLWQFANTVWATDFKMPAGNFFCPCCPSKRKKGKYVASCMLFRSLQPIYYP